MHACMHLLVETYDYVVRRGVRDAPYRRERDVPVCLYEYMYTIVSHCDCLVSSHFIVSHSLSDGLPTLSCSVVRLSPLDIPYCHAAYV